MIPLITSLLVLLSLLSIYSAYRVLPTSSIKQHHHSSQALKSTIELDVGEFENVQFTKIGTISPVISKYRVEALIKAKSFNEYLIEYKAEMKRRKVIFPGFRPGSLPPFVMGDVRKYLICYGLENLLGQLCNINGLEMRSETGDTVKFGEDKYYEEIILKDDRGYGFADQRDAWREGNDYSFAAEFFAFKEEEMIEDVKETEVVDTTVVDTEPSQ